MKGVKEMYSLTKESLLFSQLPLMFLTPIKASLNSNLFRHK